MNNVFPVDRNRRSVIAAKMASALTRRETVQTHAVLTGLTDMHLKCTESLSSKKEEGKKNTTKAVCYEKRRAFLNFGVLNTSEMVTQSTGCGNRCERVGRLKGKNANGRGKTEAKRKRKGREEEVFLKIKIHVRAAFVGDTERSSRAARAATRW